MAASVFAASSGARMHRAGITLAAVLCLASAWLHPQQAKAGPVGDSGLPPQPAKTGRAGDPGVGAAASFAAPLPGFVVHFDFIANRQQGVDLVRIAARNGARVINVVPPAHVWDDPRAVRMLDAILEEAARLQLAVLFTRIDAALPPDASGNRVNYLYAHILNQPGRLPDGSATERYFRTTAGRAGYAEWMEEETRYYATRYGKMPNLLGINLGPFSEPFASERGGFLEYMAGTGSYELTQYTPEAAKLWHEWLRTHFQNIAEVNREYGTAFASLEDVPLPRNDADQRFGARAPVAYFDFARTLNDWFVERYERCRRIWHEVSGRADVPFILQFSGFVAEKLAGARPGAAAFDVAGWIARADAIGLSLYTNNGYPDYGHASIIATVRLTALARDLGKDIFVLEGGCEAPNVVLNETQLRFTASVADSLSPKVWIYEFLKEKFDEEYRWNPGKLVRADGRQRGPAVRLLRTLFNEIQQHPRASETPALLAMVDSPAARENPALGRASLALFDLAGTMPVRWVTGQQSPSMWPQVPRVRLVAVPGSDELTRGLLAVPQLDAPERDAWRSRIANMVSAIHVEPSVK